MNNFKRPVSIFQARESRVQSYARVFPTIFKRAEGSCLFDTHGKRYLDFLAGAGSLNYGHNNPRLTRALLDYISGSGITHSLDLHTEAKANFLTAFERRILIPRNLSYRVQFTGPTGTNAVEAALKIARNVTNRQNVVAFTNGFHGVTLGSIAATGNTWHRSAAGILPVGVTRMPFDGYLGPDVDTSVQIEKMLRDPSSGVDLPAAFILETVQGEGGLNVARLEWLRSIRRICSELGILLIVDDIQAGCGRTGKFFSFENAGIEPDIVTLSKSLSGYGLPFALTLLKPEYDRWKPGQHNGTFRGNNHAFVTAAAALDAYWSDGTLERSVARSSQLMAERLSAIRDHNRCIVEATRGIGLMRGLVCKSGEIATNISETAFKKGLIVETSGPTGEVIKCLCPLTITAAELSEGLDILSMSIAETAARERTASGF